VFLLLTGCGGETQPEARTAPAATAAVVAAPAWGRIALGGGGAVPGLALPAQGRDVAYMRTDVGGCYRWDEGARRWTALLDHLGPERWNHYGVASLAADPHDPAGATVVAALGKYTDSWAQPSRGVVVRSRDGGRTWQDTGLTIGVSSNRDQAVGERLAFDPERPGVVWCASRADGLHRSGDGGASWQEVALPAAADGTRPQLAAVLPAGGKVWLATRSQGVLVGGDGAAFAPAPGAPAQVRRLVGDAAGGVWAAHAAGLALFADGAWRERAPAGVAGAFQAVAADPRDPARVIAAPAGKHGLPLFRSRDRGLTWERTEAGRQPTRPWWPQWHWFSSVFWLGFDPHHPGRVWASDWYAAYRTDDVWAERPQWTNLVDGHEEVVAIGGLYAPPAGPVLLVSGAADVGGFAHLAPDQAPARSVWDCGLPAGLGLTGIDGAATDPRLVAAVGRDGHHGRGGGGLSRDGGATWTPFAALPGSPPAGGRIAVDAGGRHLVWHLQDGQGVFTSADHGASWRAAEPAADLRGPTAKPTIFAWNQPLAADRVRPATFYLLHDRRLWRSEDGGVRFLPGAALAWERSHALACAPAAAGELWIAAGGKGLWWSRDGGTGVSVVAGVEQADLVAVGAGRGDAPTVFVLGRIGGVLGLWASADRGASWQPLGDAGQRFGNQPNTLAGDPRVPGRVFIGTNGSGFLWAQK
jgi:xyloglucan-specific exo-beta-1,4-glucanase